MKHREIIEHCYCNNCHCACNGEDKIVYEKRTFVKFGRDDEFAEDYCLCHECMKKELQKALKHLEKESNERA